MAKKNAVANPVTTLIIVRLSQVLTSFLTGTRHEEHAPLR